MKDKHRAWLKLTRSNPPAPTAVGAATNENLPPLIMRLLPEIVILEQRLLLSRDSRGRFPPGLGDSVSAHLFGVQINNVAFEEPVLGHYALDDERELHWAWRDFEDQFEIKDHLAPEEVVTILIERYNIDFRDDRGAPLLCTKLLGRQAEAGAKGLCGGRLPDRGEVAVAKFASSLQADAEAFLRKKRGESR